MPGPGRIGGACPSTINPTTFGYNASEGTGYDFSLEFDSRSVVVAMSVNMGILTLSALEVTSLEKDETDYFTSYCNASS